MCNKLHPDSVSIPERGTGWKLFSRKDGEFTSWCTERNYDKEDGWVVWDEDLGDDDDAGFCFFPTKETARGIHYALPSWSKSNTFLMEIEYEEGVGKHVEPNVIRGYYPEVALCKRFRIKE